RTSERGRRPPAVVEFLTVRPAKDQYLAMLAARPGQIEPDQQRAHGAALADDIAPDHPAAAGDAMPRLIPGDGHIRERRYRIRRAVAQTVHRERLHRRAVAAT